MSGAGVTQVICQLATDRWPVGAGTVASVVTSPPYNAGIDYNGDPTGDQMPWDEYRMMAQDVMAETHRALIEPGGRCWINVTPSVPAVARDAGDHSGQTYAERVSLIDIWTTAATVAGLSYRDTICWPTPGRGGGTAWGSYQSPSGPNLRGEWEAILCFSKGPWGRPMPEAHRGWQDSEGGWPALTSNVWRIHPESDRTHPAPYPIELPYRCIRLGSFPGELIVDPFAGSGTTLLAARNLGRDAIGLDRSPEYVRMAEERLSQLTMFGTVA